MIDDVLTANGLKDANLELFKAALKPSHLPKGAFLVSAGQIGRYLAIVENGYLRTYHLDEEGNEITTEFSTPNSFCSSYYSFYSNQPSFEYIEAITDCDLLLLSYHSLRQLYSDNLIMNVFGRTVLEKACVERDLRLKKIMHQTAAEKYEWFLENYSEVYKVAKLTHIASFLGVRAETLSRVRRKMIS